MIFERFQRFPTVFKESLEYQRLGGDRRSHRRRQAPQPKVAALGSFFYLVLGRKRKIMIFNLKSIASRAWGMIMENQGAKHKHMLRFSVLELALL